MIRMGWIGCGRHANEMLLPQLHRSGFEIASLCDVDEEALHATARRFGVTATASDWRALVADPSVQAIGVAAGPQAHADVAAACIERRLPVFVEKPPALTAERAQSLADQARAQGVPVAMGFMKRYSTANRIAHRVLSAGDFGPRVSFLGEYMTAPTYFAKDVDYSGFYLHHCVHYMDLVPHLLGEPVRRVSTRRHELAPGKLLLHVDFGFASGAIATLVMGTHQSRATPMEWWQVMGDHRRVEVRNVHEVRYFRAPKFKVEDPLATLEDAEDTLIWEPNLTVAAHEDHKGYHALLRDFAALVRGEPNSMPLIDAGARAMRVLEAVVRSGDEGGLALML
jgi:myo-inositol 2-dehydrogenase/D-chiro-inositol 1-dehydrogenase